ncbi:sterol 3-beta-glucosyltransferase [Pichia kluyveri]|uniref:Sterol 3-beta-glucosyltransferase n=1 Tax=Pichia kluyveri TaxID=36015 RepID=A0AAV5R0W5_PICKL|nr:sterol 3-beta-glucosyltransferase [Pichia kluyveri]
MSELKEKPNTGSITRNSPEKNESSKKSFKKSDILTAGPKLIVKPAQHVLHSASKLTPTLNIKHRRHKRKESASSVNSNDSQAISDNELHSPLSFNEDDIVYKEINTGSDSDISNSVYSDEQESLNEIENRAENVNLRPSIAPSPEFPSLYSSKSITSEAKKVTQSSSKLINNISRKTLSPVRHTVTGVSLMNINSSKLSHSKSQSQSNENHDLSESMMQGISRSFAGYLTTASVYAGFQDIEDEDREVESMRNRDSIDEKTYTNAVSGIPDDLKKLQVIDSDDSSYHDTEKFANDDHNEQFGYDNYGAAYSHDNISLNSHSTISVPLPSEQHTIRSQANAPIRVLPQNQSRFELSVVKRMTDNSDNDDLKDFKEKKALAISKKLKDVFQIDDSEEFLSDYPCWLMGDVLLQGHIYITNNNILFFAFLPKKNKNAVIRKGVLSFKSYHSLRIHRKWVILKENTLSIYSSSKEMYFPELVIDLRIALKAETYGISKDIDLGTPVWIRIVTENRTHWMQAENHVAAKSWVTSIKKQIFSSRNKGDQVAIKIPLQNIIDLELTSVVGATKNLRIKVIENPKSFAVDDYFVMFFSNGTKALNEMKNAIKNSGNELSMKDDEKNWKESDMINSKMEVLKKSSSFVTTTNLKPKEVKKNKFKELRDLILSSDEEEEQETESEDEIENMKVIDDYADNDESKKSAPLSRKPSSSFSRFKKLKSLGLLPIGKDVNKDEKNDDNDPENLKSNEVDEYINNIDDDDTFDYQVNESDEDTNDIDINKSASENHRWSTKSLVQGITSFTQNLIFSGSPSHFDENLAISKEGQDPYFVKNKRARDASQKRFIKRFSLNEKEQLVATYHAYLMKGLPIYGKFYVGNSVICFRSTLPGSSTIMILPLTDIENINKESGFRFGYCGLVFVIRGHEELFFEFSSSDSRDDCEIQVLKLLDSFKNKSNTSLSQSDNLISGSQDNFNSAKIKMFENKINSQMDEPIPIIIEDHPLQKTFLKAEKSYRFTLLTIGSRGDVQPYIALGKALLKEGHKVKIVTHLEFKDWILSYGIDFDQIAGDPSELMALMVQNPSINYSFIKEAKAKFRDWIDDLLVTSWSACQDTDILIESPSSIGGIHIAEKLQIPYFRAFTMPWTRTRAYPHAFMVPDQKLGGAYNYMTHVAFENGYWRGTCYQINQWRVETLGLCKTSLSAMHQNSVPFLYNMSPVVFPPSVDFPEWVKVTGYWFLDESDDYKPSKELSDFIANARKDNKKLVYIGFGSIVVSDPTELTKSVVEAVLSADVRCILNKGWSDRLGDKNNKQLEVELPPEIFNSGNVPHDWLFKQIDAAVHHGGSGTTGASLRFGLPTIIKPFFGDQKFYANRVEDMGCGVALKSLDSKSLAKALKEVTSNTRIIEKAKEVGEKIRSENGVQNAVNAIYVLMDYAKEVSISKHKQEVNDDSKSDVENEEQSDDVEGSWLLV